MANLFRTMKHVSRPILHLLIRLLGAVGAYTAAQRARHPLSKKPRILLIHPGHLGSIVMTTPLIHAIKTNAPDAFITVMVGPWSQEVLARHPDVDQVLTYTFPSNRDGTSLGLKSYMLLMQAAKQVRHGNYDLAINLRPNFWWGAALLYLARIPHRIGYALEECAPLLTEALPLPAHEHLTASYLRLISSGLKALGYTALEEPYTAERYPMHFNPTIQEQQWITEYLSEEGINLSTPLVVIHPGTGGAVKLWRADGWAACATTFSQGVIDDQPVHIILTGSKSERPLLEEIARSMTAPVTIMTTMSLGQLAALLQRARLVLGVDSGPLHLAIGQQTPTIQLFGPTDPALFGPWGRQERHYVISATQRCSTCPFIPCMGLDLLPKNPATHPCVRLIAEQDVLAVARKLLPQFVVVQEKTRV